MDKRLANIHPGEILLEEFLRPLGITAYRLAKATHLDQKRISEIIHGKRGISAEYSLVLQPVLRKQRAILAQYSEPP